MFLPPPGPTATAPTKVPVGIVFLGPRLQTVECCAIAQLAERGSAYPTGSVKFRTLAPTVALLAIGVALGYKISFRSAVQDPATACCAMKLSDIKSRFTFAAKASERRPVDPVMFRAKPIQSPYCQNNC